MLAQKQPRIQRVRNSSLAERSRAENTRGLNMPPKPWSTYAYGHMGLVGEHWVREKAVPEGAVDGIEGRMPE